MSEGVSEILKNISLEDLEKLRILQGIFGGGQVQGNVKDVMLMQGTREYINHVEFKFEPKTAALAKTAVGRMLEFYPGNRLIRSLETRDGENLFKQNSKTAKRGAYNYNKVYKAMFNQFIVWNYAGINPFNFKPPELQEEEPIVISDDEIDLICNKLIEKGLYVIADMVRYAVNSGLRVSEESRLRWEDIDFNDMSMKIGSKKFKTKTKRIRKVPLNKTMEEIIKRNEQMQLEKWNKRKEFVFVQKNGKPWKSDSVSKAFKKICRENDLPEEYHWHCLRSTAASNWVNRKVPIYTVQKLLGHTKTTTTQRYAKVDMEELRDAVNRL